MPFINCLFPWENQSQKQEQELQKGIALDRQEQDSLASQMPGTRHFPEGSSSC